MLSLLSSICFMQGPLSIVIIRTMISPSLMSVIDKIRPRDKPSLPADFVNEIFLGQSHDHLFLYCLCMLLLYNTELRVMTKMVCPASQKSDPSQEEFANSLHTDKVINGTSYNLIH